MYVIDSWPELYYYSELFSSITFLLIYLVLPLYPRILAQWRQSDNNFFSPISIFITLASRFESLTAEQKYRQFLNDIIYWAHISFCSHGPNMTLIIFLYIYNALLIMCKSHSLWCCYALSDNIWVLHVLSLVHCKFVKCICIVCTVYIYYMRTIIIIR